MNNKLSEPSDNITDALNSLKGWKQLAEAAEKRISALLADNEYMRWRIKEIDLLFGKNLLAMRAAVIEAEHGEGHTAGMQWIFNTLFGPGEFAPANETDAQAYFNREAEKIDVELSKCMEFYKRRREAEKEQSNG
ncbi:TPA: hypothetical protein RG707_003871 [Serratia liquefaciens]|nr:hypothetical protein [Serratia liquefaciens]